MGNTGLPIEKISIMHLNTECRFPNLKNLFTEVDVTEELRKRYNSIPDRLTVIFKTIISETAPIVDIGPHCTSPNECPFISHCWNEKKIQKLSVFDLPNIRSRKWELYSEGIISLDDPKLSELSPTQQRVVDVFKSKNRFIDTSGIKKAIASWEFPLVFLDFETINPAIPRYDKTGPYQQVPFQFSRISEMAEYSIEYKEQLEALTVRIVDPLPIIRDFVYDDLFHGSFSLKKVAPAILGAASSYDGMLVDNGTAAQRAFENIIDERTSSKTRTELIQASLEYCKKDTLVMVELVKWLFEVGNEN